MPIWDRNRKTNETPTAFRAFMDYCRMGTKRSLRTLAERYTQQHHSDPSAQKPPTLFVNTLFYWSLQHGWQERVTVWDVQQERIKAETHQAAIDEMNRRHAQMALMGQQKWVHKIQDLAKDQLTVSEANRMFDMLTKLERVARGEPATIDAHRLQDAQGGTVPIREIVMIRDVKRKDLDEQSDDGHDGHDGPDAGHSSGDGSGSGPSPAVDP